MSDVDIVDIIKQAHNSTSMMALLLSVITVTGVLAYPGILFNGVVTLYGTFLYSAFIGDKIISHEDSLETEITSRLHDKEITTRYIINDKEITTRYITVAASIAVCFITAILIAYKFTANKKPNSVNAARNKRRRNNKKVAKAIRAAESI